MKNSHNRHHLVWERRNYKTPTERTYRNLGGLIIPMPIETHRDLHFFVKPPKKPRNEMMNEVIDIMRNEQYEGLQGVYVAQDYYLHNAEHNQSPQRASLALGLANHIGKQLVFLEREE